MIIINSIIKLEFFKKEKWNSLWRMCQWNRDGEDRIPFG